MSMSELTVPQGVTPGDIATEVACPPTGRAWPYSFATTSHVHRSTLSVYVCSGPLDKPGQNKQQLLACMYLDNTVLQWLHQQYSDIGHTTCARH